MDKTTICNWERQHKTPEIRFIARIIDFLGYDPLPEPTTLPEKVKTHRTRLGLSQRKFAKLLGVDPTTLADWETGRHKPVKKSLDVIHKFFKGK